MAGTTSVRTLVALALLGAAAAGCAGGSGDGPSGPTPQPTPGPDGVAFGNRGWLDEHEEWSAAEDIEDLVDAAAMPEEAVPAGTSAAEAGGEAAPSPGWDEKAADGQQQLGLRAGSVDDNERFDEYLRYREAAAANGVVGRPFDPTGRLVVTVRGADGRPVLGARVSLADGGDAMTTGADGRALLFRSPGVAIDETGVQGQQQTLPSIPVGPADVVVDYGGRQVSVPVEAGLAAVAVELQAPGTAAGTVPLDIDFVIDATGSMADEIDRLRGEMIRVSERIAALDAHPDVRFAMTVYRDRGDLFVTRTFDFTGDVEAFTRALSEVRAEDGGDEPEDVESALAATLDKPAWREGAVHLAFLVADAPPHLDYRDSTPYTESLARARAAGVRIFPIASSGLNDTGELVFRELAEASLGRFVFLTYGADGATPGDETDHHVDDYSVLALDDLVVRLVEDQLAPLAG